MPDKKFKIKADNICYQDDNGIFHDLFAGQVFAHKDGNYIFNNAMFSVTEHGHNKNLEQNIIEEAKQDDV